MKTALSIALAGGAAYLAWRLWSSSAQSAGASQAVRAAGAFFAADPFRNMGINPQQTEWW